MKSHRTYLLLTLASLFIVSVQAATPVTTVAAVKRYLAATHFADTFKGGILKANVRLGRDSPVTREVLASPNMEREDVVAPVLAQYFTIDEAKALTRFYKSAAGKAFLGQELTNVGSPTTDITLPHAQAQELGAFSDTVARRREMSVMGDKSIRAEYVAAIQRHFSQ